MPNKVQNVKVSVQTPSETQPKLTVVTLLSTKLFFLKLRILNHFWCKIFTNYR